MEKYHVFYEENSNFQYFSNKKHSIFQKIAVIGLNFYHFVDFFTAINWGEIMYLTNVFTEMPPFWYKY